MSFETFSLDPLVIDSLREMNYLEPTDIQRQTIPLVLEGGDLIALAQTGSGKTAACAIPLTHIIEPDSLHIQALVVVPTRELALQYSTETQKIGRLKKLKVFALFGGESMDLQKAKLKNGVHILIVTPGRLIDFIFSRAIDLSHVKTLVLDEADQMLGMGFLEDLEFIMGCLVQPHQTLLFSATMPEGIRKIAKTYMKTPKELSLISTKPTPSNLEHQFCFCKNPKQKDEELIELLKHLSSPQCIIFAGSRFEVEGLYRKLKGIFPECDFLHGGLDQGLRTIITNKFLKGKIRMLIATDVAARGLDFSLVTHVINLHLPKDRDTYLHRSGRAGRSGRSGTCITLITARDLAPLNRLLKTLSKEPQWVKNPPPSLEEPSTSPPKKKRFWPKKKPNP